MTVMLVLATGAFFYEWQAGWLDWIDDMASPRRRRWWLAGAYVANFVAAAIVVLIPVQLLAPDEQESSNETAPE